MEKESGRVGEGLLGPNVISCIAQIIDDCQDLLVEPDEEEEADITEAERPVMRRRVSGWCEEEEGDRLCKASLRALAALLSTHTHSLSLKVLQESFGHPETNVPCVWRSKGVS